MMRSKLLLFLLINVFVSLTPITFLHATDNSPNLINQASICSSLLSTSKSEIASKQWNNTVGKIWRDLISQTHLPPNGVIVEIAPGAVPKVGLGLSQINFHGKLFIVEPERKSAKHILSAYRELLPFADIILINQRLDDAIDILPTDINLVVSNHPLDDMIAGESLTQSQFQTFFSDHYSSPAEATQSLWNKMESSPLQLNQFKVNIQESWYRVLKSIKPTSLIISQYESYFFKSNGLIAPDKHALDVLNWIKDDALNLGYLKHPVYHPFIDQPDRWLHIKTK